MPRAWIETHYEPTDQTTEWRVVVDGQVVHRGEVPEDLTGVRAHEQAQQWASKHGFTLEGWKHAAAVQSMFGDLRSRTSTDRSTPIRMYGWAICTAGEGRESVGVSPQQMADLGAGALPCPVCGEGCGATIEPATDVATHAVVWNGTRWH